MILLALIKGFELDEYGVVVSYMVFGFIVSGLNLLDIQNIMRKNRSGAQTSIRQMYVFPLIASLIMGGFVWLVYIVIKRVLPSFVALLASVLIGMLIYLICVLKMHVINEHEYADLPMGKRMQRFGKRLHLI